MPDSNSVEIHPLWKKIPPYTFFNLGNRLTLNIGVELFLDEVVQEIRVNPQQGIISAWVDSLGGVHEVKLIPEGNTLVSRCGCADFRHDGFCHHVASAAALAFHLMHGSTFGYRKPSESYIAARRHEFNESAAKFAESMSARGGSEPHYATSFLLLAPGEHSLEAEYFHHPTVKVAELDELLETFPTLAYPGSLLWMQRLLPQVLEYAFDLKLPVMLAIKNEVVVLQQRIRETELIFHLNGKNRDAIDGETRSPEAVFDFQIEASDAQNGKALPDHSILLDAGLILCHDGKVFRFDIDDSAPWTRLMQGKLLRHPEERSWCFREPVGNETYPPDRETINRLLLGCALSLKDWKREPICISDEEGKIPVADLPRAGLLQPVFCLERNPLAVGERVIVDIRLAFDGDTVHSACLVEQLQMSIAEAEGEERFFAAKGRVASFRAILLRMLTAEDPKAAKKEARASVAEDAALTRRTLWGRLMKRLITSFAAHWSGKGGWTPLVATGEQAPSQLWEVDRQQFAIACLALQDETTRFERDDLGQKIFEGKDALFHALEEVSRAAAVAGASILVDGKPIIRDKVEVALHALQEEMEGEANKIDWFELRPEVRCGEFTIRPEDWDRMLSGQLLLQKGDGSLVLPELDEAVLRDYLKDLDKQRRKTSRKKGNSGMRVNRLEMLEALELRRHGATVKLPPEVETTYQALQNFDQIPQVDIPKLVIADLRDYQKQAVDWLAFLYTHRFGACLADDMGLGKTLQAITFLADLRSKQDRRKTKAPHLVVMPTSLIFNWKSEFARFCPDITVAEYVGPTRNWAQACEHEVILTTYDTLRIDKNRIVERAFDVVILDEAQAAKNLTSARFKALTHLKSRFTLVLTGTPMENHVGEYYAIMQLAVPGLFGNYREFKAKIKRGNEEILRRARPFILRRTKARILTELPPKQETEVYLEMTELQKEVYTRMVAEVKAEVLAAFDETFAQRAGIAALAALLRLRQVCIDPNLIGAGTGRIAPKFNYVLETLRELNDEGHSVLVFSSFAKALDLLGKAAEGAALPVLHLNGKTPPNQRREAVGTFQSSEQPLNFFISLKAGGSGLNLTKASYVIHLDPWWNPAAENQASDRAHRIGQTEHVHIQRLIMRHTIEEKIMVLKERKQKLFSELIDGSGSRAGQGGNVLTREDVDFLLSDS